jgi:hypothetical protein
MRCIKDMNRGEVGYCVDWIVTDGEINGEYSVAIRPTEGRKTQVCRYDNLIFSISRPGSHMFVRLKGASCIFN